MLGYARAVLTGARRRRIGPALLAALAVLGAFPGAGLAEDTALEISQAVYDDAGQPWIGAAFTPDTRIGTVAWWICRPGAECALAPSADGWLKAGPVPSGTTFEARAVAQGVAYAVRSPVWNGPLTAVTRPTLKGRLAVGQKVRPVGAHWTGGWDRAGDGSFMHVEACRTARARGCETLSAQGGDYPGSGAPPVIARRYAGWYLYALDVRYSKDAVFAGVGYRAARLVPTVKVGPTSVRSRAYGPVRPR